MLELLASKMAGLFMLMSLGFLCKRRGWIKDVHLEGLGWVVVDVCMPALFFSGIITTASKSIENKALLIVGGFGLSVLGWLLGWLALGLSRKRLENKGTFLFLCAVGNSSFLPLPLAEALWGPAGIQGCLFYVLGNNLFLFSAGIGLLAGSQKRGKALVLKGILHPQAIATGLALASVAVGLAWPAWSLDAVGLLGKSTIPLAMLVAGGLLAGVDFKSVENIDLLGLSLGVKLLALPLLVGLTLKTLGIKGIFADILFLEACMPCLASSGVYALRFGGDIKLASEGSFWSHVLALLTIPLFFWFLAPLP